MNDWQAFIDAVPWFPQPNADVRISERRYDVNLPSPITEHFPSLSRLLTLADATPVVVDGIPYHLLAWNATDGYRIGWLCFVPPSDRPKDIYQDHRELLESFGGIVERFNEPEDTWLLNQNDVLTAREASHDATFIREYMRAFDDAGLALPIEPSDYYCIAREANGNTTLCHRSRGDVLLFAPDHSFDFVQPLDGCPEYTLYRITGIGGFRDWVETLAMQWLAHVATSEQSDATEASTPG